MTPLLSLRGAPFFCSATLQGRAHEAKASHYISKHFCHCEERRRRSNLQASFLVPLGTGSTIWYYNIAMNKQYYVYIMTNRRNTVLYTGVTNDLKRRVYEHKERMANGFTSKYNVTKLVYYEACEEVQSAISREKQLKVARGKGRLN